jgi:predicted transcriptional regulator
MAHAGMREQETTPVLRHFRFSRTLKGMEVHFSPDVEARLQQVASASGKDAEQLVKDTVARMLENQARFIAGVQRGIEQADRGEFIEEEEMDARLEQMLRS